MCTCVYCDLYCFFVLFRLRMFILVTIVKTMPPSENSIAVNNNNNNNVIPIVISSTGVIPKSLSQSLTRRNLYPTTYYNCKNL